MKDDAISSGKSITFSDSERSSFAFKAISASVMYPEFGSKEPASSVACE